ncbi:hypothetical protein BCR33DRAFT_732563 [Rhizoclosmatium globosum]|uniref:G-protein coupled receptors family 2 profile 2 domain-containing protein n=1 Tax=Rhizoclosmatium globosum TaxID=329046 RepID=A0A1Y2D3T4_9FUNG|nr:hypothetical protein BCR33DRAFT_732563 [Rhizoclosmatium globosum]|eukprot:ORY53766.1 hypothetical protein BCR33DRAFT_732563 [Rhizoclosmatium globosum]
MSCMHCYVTVMQGALIADSYWYYYHAYGWGFPILLTTIGFIVQYVQGIKVFGYTGTYCSGADKNMRLYIFYFELWAHIALIIILYVMIFKKVVDILNKISGPPSSGQSGGHSSITTTSKNEAVNRKFLDSNKSAATASMNDSSVVASKASGLNVPVPAVVKAASIKTQQTSAMSNARVKAIVFRAILIAGGFIVIWTPPTVARVMQFLNIPVPDWLAIYMVFSLSMMGIWNSFVFYLTSYWTEITDFFRSKKRAIQQCDDQV